ncbi:MAG: DNA mismatch repair protein MutS [Verrucomicrobiae bacterium]|nr:DNA mismatch repair protein MutS [Verrucomicrobiae bacterium]
MSETVTPMMKQYHLLRRDLPPDTFLLFRLGDFYELFLEDAVQAAPILNVALTKRGETPMCGVPYHSARVYLEKLLAAGKRVALCEQVGGVQTGKLVQRQITRILSPGTLEDVGLESSTNNFTAAIHVHSKKKNEEAIFSFGLAFIDLSTGEFFVTELSSYEALLDEIVRVSPAEVVAPRKIEEALPLIKKDLSSLELLEDYLFDPTSAHELLSSHFKVQSLDGFGADEVPMGIIAAGGLLHYLTRKLRRDVSHLRTLRPYHHHNHLLIDATTQSHLELVNSRAGRGMTLLGALDRTKTPMGSRMLREWMVRPLSEPAAITARLDVLALLLDHPLLLGDLLEELSGIRDMERSLSRLSQNSANARDLVSLSSSLGRIPHLKKIGASLVAAVTSEAPLLQKLIDQLHTLAPLHDKLVSALVEEPPATIKEGGMIREGFDRDLDELRLGASDGKKWIASLQEQEIQRTGIKSLKVRFNAIFGYFIEVTSSNLAHVPTDYIRKQTTANGERFVTPELKEMEGKILGAQERSKALELALFQELRAALLDAVSKIQETASAAGALDVFSSLAETARLYGYTRPQIDTSTIFSIIEGRHPVIDQQLREKTFVPNDALLDGEEDRMAIITGPNMAGKSTYLKQCALLTIMAQMGSYVPAKKMHLGIVDRLFTRVGASDDLARGQSTFMVEMNETSKILHHATRKSLVLLDEIGRGTATFDGLSLAWSVAEYLYDFLKARTMFATHYHELPDLARTRPGIKNLNVAVRERNEEIVFLHKIVPGAADRSYGIAVARLAGLPHWVIERAQEILVNLEKAELNAEGRPQLASHWMPQRRASRKQVVEEGPTLFD